MKKINNKGFMLAELLAVTVVILVIFTAIYINFYPTMGEYENRISYNDIDSTYDSYYFKVFLLKYFDSNKTTENDILNTISTNKYVTIVANNVCQYALTVGSFSCSDLVNTYGIKEVILSNYQTANLKTTYPKTGLLYKYIQNLPDYVSATNDEKVLYRIVTKTKTGYTSDQLYAKKCGQITYSEWSNWKIENCQESDICQKEYKKVFDYNNGTSKPINCDTNPLCYKTGNEYHIITYPCVNNCNADIYLYRTRTAKSNDQDISSWTVSPCS